MADDNDHPRSPTHHDHNHNHNHQHQHQHEISAAVALDNVNTSRESLHNNANLGESNSGRAGTGHERGFVQPASYLRRRGLSHPMAPSQPERAVDAEEQMGLVSCSCRVW
jgi:5'-AMP-activated protein kinase, regulatory gamma subunit